MYKKVIKTYKKNFKGVGLPSLLKEMLYIDEFVEEYGIAEGFMLRNENSDEVHSSMLGISMERTEILKKFIFLAQADGTGSNYSIFRLNSSTPIEENPVVFFGSEGEILFAAANFKDWLRVISTGVEPNAFDTPLEYRINEDDMGDSTDEFRDWLETKGVKPIINNQKEVDALVAKADKYIPEIIEILNMCK
ncbi:hypothetical protein HCB45_14985 [Listeria sp. FSL L7-0091]|uniref:SMI1/KNR4 family protein n=1 Tax=Listeria farberi TaxID=2713500 RepID=A0ABR6SJG8_9LIST|nr:hypothetical protein [Listeria farberi]MBC1374395.1 hypothetical protein [Listeria farberi]MBC1380953.1 hypothetical protein [Listeria farberi]MBC2262850.1 hypothetical protein [Listeria farberi]